MLSSGTSRYRVGLSRRVAIPSLLRVVRKDPAPSAPVKRKLSRKNQKQDETAIEGDGQDGEAGAEGKDVNHLLMMEEEYYSP